MDYGVLIVIHYTKPILLEKIDYNNLREILKGLEKYENIIKDYKIENAIVVTKDCEAFQCFENNSNVWSYNE